MSHNENVEHNIKVDGRTSYQRYRDPEVANNTAAKASQPVAPTRNIRSFKDPSMTTGLFLLDLLDAIRPGIVDPLLVVAVDASGNYDHRRQNARKMNALIVLVPEDIVDIRPRLSMTFVGSLMSIANQ
ncbi:hypothetical protein BDZ89DRAFT_1120200 [Hymenopellis radicata]|nr:hypothetical protein BDZ89DRAFT_1120200 [Hymenopellis radicata]